MTHGDVLRRPCRFRSKSFRLETILKLHLREKFRVIGVLRADLSVQAAELACDPPPDRILPTPHTPLRRQIRQSFALFDMETDDWAQRAHAGFFSSPRTVVSEDEDPPSFFAPAWANPPPAPVLALASDTLTPRYSGATSGPTPRGFVPTSRGSSLSRTALGRADPWTPDVPPSCGPDRAEGGSLSRLRPRPLSFALEVASAMVPQALFGGQSKDSGSGLNEHPPLAQIPADSKHVNLKTPESVRGGGESSATKVSGSRGGRSRAGSAAKSRKLDDEERRDLLDSDVIWGTTINCLPDEVLLHGAFGNGARALDV